MDLYCAVSHAEWGNACTFYCQDDQLVKIGLNNFQFKNNYFVTTCDSNLNFEKLHIQAIKYIQKELTLPYYDVAPTI